MGIFGNLFDFNGDGKLDPLEQAMAKQDESTDAGLDPYELETMGYSERREALQNVGLNPDDYDV